MAPPRGHRPMPCSSLRAFCSTRYFLAAFLLCSVAYVSLLRRLFVRAPAPPLDPSLAPFRHLPVLFSSGSAGGARWQLTSPATSNGSGSGSGGAPLSFLHDLPSRPAAGSLVTFVCEVPHGGTAKYEVQTGAASTPIAQDSSRDGSPRFYPWRALLNYGMVPQTLEDPATPSAATGLVGDGDPLDALDVWPVPCAPGQVYSARVLGALAMVDGGATDWKVIVVRNSGGLPQALLSDLLELAPALESLAGDEAAAAAAAADAQQSQPLPLAPQQQVITLPGLPAPASPQPAAQAVRLHASLLPQLPAAPLAAELCQQLRSALPGTEGGGWAAPAGQAQGGTTFRAPAGAAGPGARHATHPPALATALCSLGQGGELSVEQASVLRGSVRAWVATRLLHAKEWLRGYKAAAEGGEGAKPIEFLWEGAFLDAQSAQHVIDATHKAYKDRQ